MNALAMPRGYHVPYRGSTTACPGCGRSHWYVGRLSAECAFCTTAVPLEESAALGAGMFRSSRVRRDLEFVGRRGGG